MSSVGFIGLGNMGLPMAVNLLKAGHDVRVFDLNAVALEAIVSKGGVRAKSAALAAKGADVVITMLPNSGVVESVYLGAEGILAQSNDNSIFIDCSTIDPKMSQKVAAATEKMGSSFLDAPVSGGVMGAQAGTLCFMVGGKVEVLARASDLLGQMGKKIIHTGDHGTGQLAKICNNMMAGILMAATAEALALGMRNGLAPSVLSDVMRNSSGGNFMVEKWNPWPNLMAGVPASNDYHGGFQVQLMLKDLGLAIDCAQYSSAAVPLGAAARNVFALHGAASSDNPSLDISSIQRLYFPHIQNQGGSNNA
ncbi:3-hydroxyisobutyrate dehydrogenase [Pseudomonas sp. BN411]|uniref:3-hydroxyisobutyrate dehydrogenase n=1 Tax=Pseudomonas sp. BN411 TaxID=2567887 RepID=UPI002454A673|nr:3-hydroxyisobutyrate dehydrogenase [Pseudomonas sp. BN411]MDH4564224.1 3-hydroxyisobutyrate dehydrogenase [Pseudomonas sp. BN411]